MIDKEETLAEIAEEGLSVYWCPECKTGQQYSMHKVHVGLSSATVAHQCVRVDVGALIQENVRLTESLEFYADPMTYYGAAISEGTLKAPILSDEEQNPIWDGVRMGEDITTPGHRARRALIGS